MKKLLVVSCALLLALCAVGCGNAGNNNKPLNFTITGFGWAYENIDPSFWSNPPGVRAFYDFWVRYSGTIAYNNIVSASVTAPTGVSWNLVPNSSYVDTQNKVLGGWGRWYENSSPYVLPIGNFQVTVKLSDGSTKTYSHVIPAPGMLTTGSYTSMQTEDLGSVSGAAQMVPRAKITGSQTLNQTTKQIDLNFMVLDAAGIVYDGNVWFYDASDNYLGGFFYFRDPKTGGISALLISGGGTGTFDTHGVNELILGASDVTLANGVSQYTFFSTVSKFIVVLTDGAQYGPQSSGNLDYDGRSFSAMTPLTVN